MSMKNAYLLSVLEDLKKKNAHEPEFLQAAEEVLESLEPVVEADPRYDGRQFCKSGSEKLQK